MASSIQLSTETHFPLQENGYAHKCFPVRNIRRFKPDNGGAWLVEYKAEKARQIETLAQNCDTAKQKSTKTKKVAVLNVAYLMKEFHLDDPSALFSINISGRQLDGGTGEDFGSFVNVLYVEAGDNNLDFETFKSFPCLEELHLQVNHISDINTTHNNFSALKRLDLSYNRLKENALLELGKLRNIKELTLRGCGLKTLHSELARAYIVSTINDEETKSNAEKKSRFPELEHLDLSENKLTDLSTFASLAGLRKLKSLNLSENKICGVPHLRLLVSHRDVSASTSCQCNTISKNTLVGDTSSTDNVGKANQFHALKTSQNIPSIEVCDVNTDVDRAKKDEFVDQVDPSSTLDSIAKIPRETATKTEPTDTFSVQGGDCSSTEKESKPLDSEIFDTEINVDLSIDLADDISLNNLLLDAEEEPDIGLEEASDTKTLEVDIDEDKMLDIDVEEAIESALHEETAKEINNVLNTSVDSNEELKFSDQIEEIENDSAIDTIGAGGPLNKEDANFPNVRSRTALAREINFTLGEAFNEGVKYGNDKTDQHKDGIPEDDVINSLKSPFPSLKSLDLSKNLIAEEEALLALTAWPALQDLKLWSNPLMQLRKQLPDTVSHHLQKMCGINVESKPPEPIPQHPIAPSISKTARTYRVKNDLPPIKRNNILMIEAEIQKAIEDKERIENPSQLTDEKLEENDGTEERIEESSTGAVEEVEDAEGIFMTQVNEPGVAEEIVEEPLPEQPGPNLKNILSDPKYAGYEELLRIDETYETEEDILIPSTVYGSVQALRHMLKNPLVFKEGNYNRKSRLIDGTVKASKKKSSRPPKEKQVDKISKALDIIRTKDTTSEENLATVLDDFSKNSKMKERFPDAKKITKRVQDKYDQVRLESLRPVSVAEQELSRISTRADKNSQDLILMRMKQGKIGDLYSSPRSTAFPRSRNSSRKTAYTAP